MTTVPFPPPGFDDLSFDEKLEYLELLWNRVAAIPETLPVPEWHRDVLMGRVLDLESDPNAGDSWDVVQERIRGRLNRKD